MPKRSSKPTESPNGRFAYEGLERSMHEKARLGIMTSLLTHREGLSFNDLKKLCELTDGNLSRHLDVLQEDGLIIQQKQTGPGRATTLCQLSPAGRKRFLEYIEALQRVVADASAAARETASSPSRLGFSPNG